MRFVYKKEFIKHLETYPALLQQLILKTDQEIKTYLATQNAPYGLRIKKIGPKTFEARVTDRVRIVWVKDNDCVYFTLLGTHDEVRRFIREL